MKGIIKMFKRQKTSTLPEILAFFILSAIILSGCSNINQGRHKQPKKPIYPGIQGLYESCEPDRGSFCLDRLKQMASAGFTLVVNYEQLYGTAEQELAYANQARSLGMKVIWNMSDPAFWNGTDLLSYYSDLAATCACSDNKGFIRYCVSLVKDLPATWGYYVGDEVKRSDYAKMKKFADFVRQLDPSHPRLIIAGENPPTMGANLKTLVDTAEFIGDDIYPVGTSEPITTVGSVAHSLQTFADQNGKKSVIVLQAMSWSQYPQSRWVCSPFPGCARFPTEPELRQMRDLALDNARPEFLLWYSYFDIFQSRDAAKRWSELIKAIGTIPATPTH